MARGLCAKHYAAYLRGDPQVTPRPPLERPVRYCQQCGEQLAPGRRKGAMFCGQQCKNEAQRAKREANPRTTRDGPCTAPPGDCPRPRMARGLCQKHYNRFLSKGTLDDVRKNAKGKCTAPEGCDREHLAGGLCDRHYRRQRAADRRAAQLASRVGRKCVACEAPLAPTNGSTLFCSRACKDAERVSSGRAAEAGLRYHFMARYGLTPQQVNQMAEAGCSICRTTDWPGRHNRPHVDHDHETGQVRGILCSECNTGLGKFKDKVHLLENALAYLQGSRPVASLVAEAKAVLAVHGEEPEQLALDV